MPLRVLGLIILLISVLFMPFWISAVLAIAGMVYFSFFVEAVLLFLLSDLLFGAHDLKLFDTVFASFVMAIICLIILELFKKRLRLN